MGRIGYMEKLTVRGELAPHTMQYTAGKRYRYQITRIDYTYDIATDEPTHAIGDLIMGYRVTLGVDRDGYHRVHPHGQGHLFICSSNALDRGVMTDPFNGLPLGFEMVDRNS